MKRIFEKGDLISYANRGHKVLGQVENVWRSKNALNVRPIGQREKFEVPMENVKKVL